MDERDAIELLRRGEITALESLVRTHQVRAIRTAYLITRDTALAQDVVQAAFVRAFERIGQLDPTRAFGPWFMTSVVHAAIKASARLKRTVSLDDAVEQADHDDGQPRPDLVWEQAETAEEVWAVLGRLTREQRAAVVLRYYVGLNQAEMSQTLGCPPSTIKWRLHAARRRLRVLLMPLMSTD